MGIYKLSSVIFYKKAWISVAEEHGTWGSFLLMAMFECPYVSEYWELERARVIYNYITLK